MWVIILFKRIIFILSALIFAFPFCAYADGINASAAIVTDAKTGAVLYEKNAYIPLPVASTTKIMTALLAIESGRLDERLTVTADMLTSEGSSLGLKAGDRLSFYDLTVGMMLTSGNDAADCTAIILAGSKKAFAEMMNRRAAEIGMLNTEFVTPSGLDEGGHHSTAYDMALLTAEAVSCDIFCEIVSKQSADIKINGKTVTVYNHNKLLARDKSIFGVKTGYTRRAGRCLVTAKKYKGNTVICVTLNCPDDWETHLRLYKKCQPSYKKQRFSGGVVLPTASGDKRELGCSYAFELYSPEKLDVREYFFPFLYAPVGKGDAVGTVCVYSKSILIERLPIEADEVLLYNGTEQFGKTPEVYGGVRSRIKEKIGRAHRAGQG
jgi:D-alanyl-D-alanine carboxypeptidase